MDRQYLDFEGVTLHLPSGALAKFDYPIKKVISFEDRFIVLVNPPPGNHLNENVFGITCNGEIAWQVPERKHAYGDSPYTDIQQVGEQVAAYNWDGGELLLDHTSGTVLEENYRK